MKKDSIRVEASSPQSGGNRLERYHNWSGWAALSGMAAVCALLFTVLIGHPLLGPNRPTLPLTTASSATTVLSPLPVTQKQNFAPGTLSPHAGSSWHTSLNPMAIASKTHTLLDAQLMAAVKSGDVSAVESLVSQGANPNANNGDSTALTLAVLKWGEPLVNALIVGKADVDMRDPDGSTPLAVAAYVDNKAAAIALLNAGAHATATTADGQTPLNYAIWKGYPSWAELLRSHQAQEYFPHTRLNTQ